MDNRNHKERIRKILALAESPNEHEAKAALLKARQLMAEHKLSESGIRDTGKSNVLKVDSGLTCSKRRFPWMVTLAAVIGENFCCKSFRSHWKGKQTYTVGFIGFEEDVNMCVEILRYAVDCIQSWIKRLRCERSNFSSDQLKRLCDSYGYGFAFGIEKAFSMQQQMHVEEWGLVLAVPKEVEEACSGMRKTDFKAKASENLSPNAYSEGYRDGKEFDTSRRLQERSGQDGQSVHSA